jgi:hypothetical protein
MFHYYVLLKILMQRGVQLYTYTTVFYVTLPHIIFLFLSQNIFSVANLRSDFSTILDGIGLYLSVCASYPYLTFVHLM